MIVLTRRKMVCWYICGQIRHKIDTFTALIRYLKYRFGWIKVDLVSNDGLLARLYTRLYTVQAQAIYTNAPNDAKL